jgi:hypothetical protein
MHLLMSTASKKLAHNVPAVYDVFAPQKCVRSERGSL